MTLPVEAPWLRLNYGFIAKRKPDPLASAKAFMSIVQSNKQDLAA